MTGLFRVQLLAVWLFCLPCLVALAQPVAFEVPEQVTFAGQRLKLTPDAQAVIKKHGQSLVRNAKFYRAMTERADAYFPLVERIFREEGLPDDFKFLVIQESGLASDVVSRSNAVGYWQFKAETATELGLRVDPDVDERMHIMASSRGAARYLVRNNNVLQNWTYALLSYYSGLTGSKPYTKPEYIGATEMELDSSTHFYVLKFLAHKIAFENAVNRSPNPGLQIAEYPDCEGKTLRQIAAETNIELAQLEMYNKWCRTGVVPADRDYTVIVPVTGGQQPSWMAMTTRPTPQLGNNLKPWKEKRFFGLIEVEPTPVDPSLNQEQPVFFSWNGIKAILARKADNINKLALAAGVSKEDLMDYNDLRVFDLIVPGQVYYVKPKRRKAKIPFHTVRSGETIWEVAQNYGLTLEALMRKNRMRTPEKLATGRILWLRHIRPEDHPIEYDKSVPQAAPVPVTRPIDKPLPVLASTANPPATAVVTAPPKLKDPDAPSLQELGDKYEDVQPNTKAEQVTVPLETGDEAQATPFPKAPQNETEAAGGERVPTPAKAEEPAKPAALPAAKPAPAKPAPSPVVAAPKPAPVTAPAGPRTHTVQPKETLYGITKQYGIAAAELVAANPTLEQGLKVGMVLTIPSAQPAAAPPAALPAATHTVAPGETFYSIAKRYGLKVDSLKALNPEAEAGLKIGQVLRLK